jgi:hypothetical protein
MNATRIFAIALIAFSIHASAGNADSLRWPKIDKEPAYPWPKTTEDLNLLNTRFNQASKDVQGSPEDIFKICDAIHKHPKEPSSNVKEIRWLSPNTVIVSAGWYSSPIAAANYYYVLKRTKNKWQVIAYYMLMIS